MTEWKDGDWVIHDRDIGQIKKVEDGYIVFSTGFIETSGKLTDRIRPLTIRNKTIAESMEGWYKELKDIPGNAGFNYPDINNYFTYLALMAMDDAEKEQESFKIAKEFIEQARDYKKTIHGIDLFRPQIGRRK